MTVDEVYGYVSKKVPEVTGQNQHPVKKGEVEGQLVLGAGALIPDVHSIDGGIMIGSRHHLGLVTILALTLAGCADSFEPSRIGSFAMKSDGASPPPRIYVANESSNDVSVIDATTFEPVGTIAAMNHSTHDLAISRDGRRLFATNLASGRVSVIDTTKRETIASIYTGERCHVVALSNDNSQLWVANIGDNTISIVDTTTFRILGTIPVSKGPTGLTFSHDGRYAFVSSQGEKTVGVIDTASHK